MSYQDEEILRDVKGNPIPQYYDTGKERFEPLTEKFGEFNFPETPSDYPDIATVSELEEIKAKLASSYVGYSTDEVVGAVKGDDFVNLDTKDIYIYDGTEWVVF